MNDPIRNIRIGFPFVIVVALALPLCGCGPNYYELRRMGQRAALDGSYGPARAFYLQAEERRPGRADNLHDLGVCSVMLARDKFAQTNHAAGMREVDDAVAYYTRAIDAQPGHQASLEGKRIALKLKGQFDEALKHAEWAAEFVGPSAKQYVLLARELEQRGDEDAALLRYRQAVAIEPKNAEAHRAFAKFLLACENDPAAVYHLQQAYRLNPGDPWVIAELAERKALPRLTVERETTP